MKKLILLIILGVCLNFDGLAQDYGKNTVKINPLGLLFGGINANYERVLFPSGALQVGVVYSSAEVTVNGTTEKTTGIGGSLAYRWFFAGEAPRGWYAAPRFAFTSLSDGNGNGTNITGIGAVAGYQWIWGSGFALDLFLGAQNLSVTLKGDASGSSLSGVLPVLGVSLGYNF